VDDAITTTRSQAGARAFPRSWNNGHWRRKAAEFRDIDRDCATKRRNEMCADIDEVETDGSRRLFDEIDRTKLERTHRRIAELLATSTEHDNRPGDTAMTFSST